MADTPTGWRKLLRDLAVDFIDSGAAAEVLSLVKQSLKGEPADAERPSRMCKCTMEPVMSDPVDDGVPEVGDTVRVRKGAVGAPDKRGRIESHAGCEGGEGPLAKYGSGSFLAAFHVGPLSDFELVERAEARR